MMPKGHSKLIILVESKRKEASETHNTRESLPRVSTVPRRSHDPLGVDYQYIERRRVRGSKLLRESVLASRGGERCNDCKVN